MNIISNIPGFQVLMLVMLAFATLGFTLLTLVTVSNAWRLRNPLIKWRSGKLYGFPFFSTLFLVFTLATGAILLQTGQTQYTPWIMCYTWISVSWFLSSYYLSKRYITDNGIVKNVNNPSQTVSWGTISDYIEKPATGGINFVFLYRIPSETYSGTSITRLELFVPYHKLESFRKLLNFKLRNRFANKSIYALDLEKFNNFQSGI